MNHNVYLGWWFSLSDLWEKKYVLNLSIQSPLLDMQMVIYVYVRTYA